MNPSKNNEKWPWLKPDQDFNEEQELNLEKNVKYSKCTNRPKHRATKEETSVRVYTINQESKYLIIRNIPSIGAIDDLIKKFSIYGSIEEYRILDFDDGTNFTDAVWMKFGEIQNARHAKRKGVKHPFYGSILDISYAPIYESECDTEEKLRLRRELIKHRTKERVPKKVYTEASGKMQEASWNKSKKRENFSESGPSLGTKSKEEPFTHSSKRRRVRVDLD